MDLGPAQIQVLAEKHSFRDLGETTIRSTQSATRCSSLLQPQNIAAAHHHSL